MAKTVGGSKKKGRFIEFKGKLGKLEQEETNEKKIISRARFGCRAEQYII